MADHSKIEWTDATWQPITGCSIVSPGCTNCYAMKLAGTRLRHHPSRHGLTIESKAGPVWNGKVRLNEQWLDQPLRWKSPRRIFVCAHGDLFHESVPDEWIDKVFAVMALAPQHTFQVLTKRSARMRDYLTVSRTHLHGWMPEKVMDAALDILQSRRERDIRHVSWDMPEWPLPNVWLGVSTERQQEADERIPPLLQTPAAVRFISAEPLLGPISLRWAKWDDWKDVAGNRRDFVDEYDGARMLDWVIVGGESGVGARPIHPDWARSLRDQCAAANVPFFFKQWGGWMPHKIIGGGDLGGDVRAGRVKILHPTGQSDVEVSAATGGRSTIPRSRYMARVGKKTAGRLLDGIEHNGMPKVPV